MTSPIICFHIARRFELIIKNCSGRWSIEFFRHRTTFVPKGDHQYIKSKSYFPLLCIVKTLNQILIELQFLVFGAFVVTEIHFQSKTVWSRVLALHFVSLSSCCACEFLLQQFSCSNSSPLFLGIRTTEASPAVGSVVLLRRNVDFP